MDTIPVPQEHDLSGQLIDMAARCDYLERVIAALVAKVGPVQLRGSDFEAARPVELRTLTSDPATAAETDAPLVWALPEHVTLRGLVTSEDQVATVLRSWAGAEPDEQASAVLRELGLPVREA